MWQSARLIAILAIGAMYCLSGCRAPQSSEQAKEAPRATAGGEALVGLRLDSDVSAFLGVPYAAAPIGDLRWRPAQPHSPRQGNVGATEYGPACPQSQGNPDWYRMVAEGFGNDPSLIPDLTYMDEDCLYLNIWTPQRDDSELLPVMIWVHGGSNVNGWAYEPNYVGSALAAEGVVVVSLNYRMGALGFLPIPFDETADIPAGNYGISDIISATKWVRENAESFGGDPGNITLFGESAGGADIYALMKSPQAEGLFRRVIVESGALGPGDMPTFEVAKERAAEMFAKAGIDSIDTARALPWQALIDLHKTTGVDYYHGPVLDGHWVRRTDATNADIDVMIGTNLNEMLMYIDGADADVLTDGTADYPADVRAALLALPMFKDRPAREIADVLSTASQFHCPSKRIAEASAVQGRGPYLYRFTRKRERADAYGAYHGAEIPYVFNTHDDWLPTDAEDHALTETMMAYWTNFARTGNPNGPGLPDWPRNVPGENKIQELGVYVGATDDFMVPFCDALSRSPQ
ncbi:carboxylesterase/lipase family protein [Hyphomonas sp.]|uniref:carboxylesterase/lipase family protein n=1 Tax=Hyphomonas sp. TaxID=87 RepID=UPI0039E69913